MTRVCESTIGPDSHPALPHTTSARQPPPTETTRGSRTAAPPRPGRAHPSLPRDLNACNGKPMSMTIECSFAATSVSPPLRRLECREVRGTHDPSLGDQTVYEPRRGDIERIVHGANANREKRQNVKESVFTMNESRCHRKSKHWRRPGIQRDRTGEAWLRGAWASVDCTVLHERNGVRWSGSWEWGGGRIALRLRMLRPRQRR